MAAYIKGISIISPQRAFGDHPFPEDVNTFSGTGYMKCIEPSYREFIDPMISRRMSRIVKMGVYSALNCMKTTGVDMPDAIIAGTGLGCLEDTEKFLSSVHTSEEKLLNPTPFIQSTHNTVAGAIALAVKCHGYNATYTQRGFSFESAIADALLQLNENPLKNILAGGFDEVTETSFEITSRLGLWKNHPVDSSRLYEYETRGSLAGEGAAFVMLSGKTGAGNVKLRSLETIYTTNLSIVENRISEWLKREGLTPAGIGLAILGLNGDIKDRNFYSRLMNGLLKDNPVTGFKHLCGEYDTSASFALWLAWSVLNNRVPDLPSLNQISIPAQLSTVLIYNHLRGKYHSAYLLEKC